MKKFRHGTVLPAHNISDRLPDADKRVRGACGCFRHTRRKDFSCTGQGLEPIMAARGKIHEAQTASHSVRAFLQYRAARQGRRLRKQKPLDQDHELCAACPSLGEGGCVSPFGDEEKVGRWDTRVMQGLGIAYGEVKTAGELRRLIDSKRPLTFCKERCPWRSICAVFDQ